MYQSLGDSAPPADYNETLLANSPVTSIGNDAGHSLPKLVPADRQHQRGLVILDFVRSVRAVRSTPLFLVSLSLFALLVLANTSDTSCRQLRMYEPPAQPTDCSVYNDIDSTSAQLYQTLLLPVFVLLFIANSSFNAPLLAVTLFLPVMALQLYAIFAKSSDIPYCQWQTLSEGTSQCMTPAGTLIPLTPWDQKTCASYSLAFCEDTVRLWYQPIAALNLAVYVFMCLLVTFTLHGVCVSLGELYSQHTGRPAPQACSLPTSQHITGWEARMWLMFDRLYERLFASEYELVEHSAVDRDSLVYALPYKLSLRAYLASVLSFFTTTGLTVIGIIYFNFIGEDSKLVSYKRAMVAAILLSYFFSLTMIVVHLCSLRAAIKRVLWRLVNAEVADSLADTLHQLKVRWFSLPFYAGSMFGSMLWTFLLLTAFIFMLFAALGIDTVREFFKDYAWRIALTVGPPVIGVLTYRICATCFVYNECGYNNAYALDNQPPNPLCYLCCDCYGLFVGGWGSWIFVVIRLLLACPIAVSRIDIPTSSFDPTARQFTAMAVTEAYRIFELMREGKASSEGLRRPGDAGVLVV